MTTHVIKDSTKAVPILIIGGGRWARVIITVLISLDPTRKCIWLTQHNAASNIDWLNLRGYSNVTIETDKETAWKLPLFAVIIASSSRDHAEDLIRAVQLNLPALCEKPFAMDVKQARQIVALSELRSTVTGVNLEFLYASYLHEFASNLKSGPPRLVEIRWCDPLSEIRHGEEKYGDINTPLVHDSLPHCWSLLRVVLGETPVELLSATYSDTSEIMVRASCGETMVHIVLNRRAPHRERSVTIDNGKYVLDFSTEPGRMVTPFHKEILIKWSGLRPLGASLDAFLKKLQDPDSSFPSSIKECLPAVELCAEAHDLIVNQLRDRLLAYQRLGTLTSVNPVAQSTLFDLMVPQLNERLSSKEFLNPVLIFNELKDFFRKQNQHGFAPIERVSESRT